MVLAKSVNLREPCYAPAHLQSLSLPVGVVLQSFGRLRSWAYDGHITSQDIPQLRQLGETPPDQKPLVARGIRCVTIHIQPVHGKGNPILATTWLRPKRFSFLPADHQGSNQQHGRNREQEPQAQNEVRCALDHSADPEGVSLSQRQQGKSINLRQLCS